MLEAFKRNAYIRLELKIAAAHIAKGNDEAAIKCLRRCIGPMNKAKQLSRSGQSIVAIAAIKRKIKLEV